MYKGPILQHNATTKNRSYGDGMYVQRTSDIGTHVCVQWINLMGTRCKYKGPISYVDLCNYKVSMLWGYDACR